MSRPRSGPSTNPWVRCLLYRLVWFLLTPRTFSDDRHLRSSCLDDEELGFLGSPWHEYSHIAEEIGLDVLR